MVGFYGLGCEEQIADALITPGKYMGFGLLMGVSTGARGVSQVL